MGQTVDITSRENVDHITDNNSQTQGKRSHANDNTIEKVEDEIFFVGGGEVKPDRERSDGDTKIDYFERVRMTRPLSL